MITWTFYSNNRINPRPLNSTHYSIIIYPQNGDRVVTTDCVTSLHTMYISQTRDSNIAGSTPGRSAFRQVVHTHTVVNQYNLVPANAFGEVTVGLASHWPCVINVFIRTCLRKGTPSTPRKGFARLFQVGEISQSDLRQLPL